MHAALPARAALRHITPVGSRGSELPTDRRLVLVDDREVDPPSCELADYAGSTPDSQSASHFLNLRLTMEDRLKPLSSGLPPGLERLAKQAAAVSALTTLVRESLPEALGPHVVSAVRRAEDLVVTVDSAAWSARVRYAGRRLKEQLGTAGQTVTGKVRVRVGKGAAGMVRG